MSLQHAAKHLAAHGRGPDTTLVHMSKEEVKSLNDLAMAQGGHLTINPHTGLPEAGILQRMLPMIAGGALTVMSGGALSPLAASLIVGGGYAATTGSLKKGLMAGLGAYGGAGMAASLGEAGAASVVPETPPAPAPVVDATPVPVTPPVTPPQTYSSPFEGTGVNAGNYPTPEKVLGVEPSSLNTSVDAAGNVTEQAVTKAIGSPVTPATIPNVVPQIAPPGSYGADVLPPAGQLPPVEPVPPPVNTYQGQFKPVGYGDRLAGNGLGNPPASGPLEATHPIAGAQTGSNTTAASSVNFKDMTPAQRLEAIKNGTSFDNLGKWASENKYTAYGMGASALMPWDEDPKQRTPYSDSDPGQQYTYEANPTGASNPDPTGRQQNYFNQRYVARAEGGMATGGLSDAQYNLGGYSDGGRLLRGPGDGVSDSIPAVIGKKQPARLADGEFVVPARIVSELGNGSTEAGARKLYAMMDRIQKARGKTVGKNKVAKNSRADKYLPA